MKQWEIKKVSVHAEALEPTLNELGQAGWEPIACQSEIPSGSAGWTVILKRPAEPSAVGVA